MSGVALVVNLREEGTATEELPSWDWPVGGLGQGGGGISLIVN